MNIIRWQYQIPKYIQAKCGEHIQTHTAHSTIVEFFDFMRVSKVLEMNYKFEYNKIESFSIFYLFA